MSDQTPPVGKEKPNPDPYTLALKPGFTPMHLCKETPDSASRRAAIYETYARIARKQAEASAVSQGAEPG